VTFVLVSFLLFSKNSQVSISLFLFLIISSFFFIFFSHYGHSQEVQTLFMILRKTVQQNDTEKNYEVRSFGSRFGEEIGVSIHLRSSSTTSTTIIDVFLCWTCCWFCISQTVHKTPSQEADNIQSQINVRVASVVTFIFCTPSVMLLACLLCDYSPRNNKRYRVSISLLG